MFRKTIINENDLFKNMRVMVKNQRKSSSKSDGLFRITRPKQTSIESIVSKDMDNASWEIEK